MNIGIENKKKEHQHVSFQKMLVIIVVLISVCVQVVYVAYSGYKVYEFSDEITDTNLAIVHQNLLDNVQQTTEQIENFFSFYNSCYISAKLSANLNLREDAYVESVVESVDKLCREAEIRSDIVRGFAVIGKNQNHKTFVFDFAQEELIEYPGVEMDILKKSGLQKELNQLLGAPFRIPEERLDEILQTYAQNSSSNSAFEQLVELCKDYCVVSDILSNVMVLVFVEPESLSEGLEQQGSYGSVLLSENGQLVFSKGRIADEVLPHLLLEESKVSLDLYGYEMKHTYIQPEGLRAITIYQSRDGFIKSNVIWNQLLLLFVLNLLTFVLVYMFSKRLIRPLKLFERVMTHFQNAGKQIGSSERSIPFGRQLLVSLLISCLIPFLFLNIFCNRIIKASGNRLLEEYAASCVAYYENVVSRFHSNCEQMQTQYAVDLIRSFEEGNREKNMELVRQFEEKMLAQRVELADYSYAIVTDSNYNILHQSMYSGRAELFQKIVNRAASNGKKDPMSNYYFWEENPVSESYVLILQLPVEDGGKNIGTILIALEGTTIDTFAGNVGDHVELAWVSSDEKVYCSGEIQNVISEQQLRVLASKSEEKVNITEEYLLQVGNQNMMEDTTMILIVDVQEYVAVLDNMLEDSLVLWGVLTLLIILISIFVMSLVLNPIVDMTKKFSDNTGTPQLLEINTGVTEINNLIQVYNNMVERQKHLQAENEKRYENEKRLITLRTQAEFKMLQHQVNPHFMFNTLEVVNLLAVGNDLHEISDIVKALAQILRFSLRGEQTVSAGEEVAALQNYLLIQRMRFEDYIKFEIEFDENLSHYSILKFILQPLVENAISHGLSNRLQDGHVLVRVEEHETNLIFTVSDNGIGMTEQELEQLEKSLCDDEEEYGYSKGGSGIGLKNIYRRLCYYYGDEASLNIESSYGVGTTVTLLIPKRE